MEVTKGTRITMVKELPRLPPTDVKSDTDVEGKLSGEVVHATGMHEAEGVPHRLRAQNTLPCDWTETAIGQRCGHDAGALAGDFNGAQLAGRGDH